MLASWMDSKTSPSVMVNVILLRSNLAVNLSRRQLLCLRHGSYLNSFFDEGRGEVGFESVDNGKDIEKRGKGMNCC